MSWADGFVIDRDPTLRKNPNCKDCFYYENEDKTCNRMGYHFVRDEDSLTSWQKCDYFDLEEGVDNYEEKKRKYDEWSKKHLLQRKIQDKNAKVKPVKAYVQGKTNSLLNAKNDDKKEVNNINCKKPNQIVFLSDEEIRQFKFIELTKDQPIPKKCAIRYLAIHLKNGKVKQIQLKIHDKKIYFIKGVYPEEYEKLVMMKIKKIK